MKKKIFTMLLGIVFIFSLSVVNIFAISQSDINSNLQKMKNKYPNGSHWNGTYYANDGSEGPWECFGFACEVFRGVFGCEMPRAYSSDMWHFANTNNVVCLGSIANPTESKVKNLLSTAKPGDIIQARGNVQHTMVVTNASDLGINVFDANSDGRNTVRVGAYLSHATVAGTYYVGLSLYRYKNYPATTTDVTPAAPSIRLSGTSTTTAYPITVSWDAVTNAASYEYYLTEFPEGWAYETNTQHGIVTGTSITFPNLTSGKYTIFAHALSAGGKQSPQSNWASFNVYAEDYVPIKTVSNNSHIYALYDCGMSWTFARDLCTDLGGHLVTITSAEENDVISDLVQSGSSDSYWLGASAYGRAEKDFAWVTDEPFTYNDWANGEPNASGENGNKELYAEIKKSYGRKWNDAKNIAKTNKGFILEIETENTSPTVTEYFNGNKYMLFDKNITWTEAKQYCEVFGGHLATINSDAENEFIKNLILQGNRSWYYLGAEKISGTWQWLDGNTVSNITWHENAASSMGTHLMMYSTSLKCTGLSNTYYPEADIKNIGFVCEIENSSPPASETFSVISYEGYSEVRNNTDVRQTVTVIAADYSDGALDNVTAETQAFAPNETKTFSHTANTRVFVWDSLSHMRPLAK